MYQLTFTPSQNIEIQNNRRQPVPNKISFNPDTVLFDKDTRLNYEINNLKDLNYLNEVTGFILANSKSKNPKVNNTIAYLMKSENAVKFFSKVAEDLKSNPNNDEIDNFYINQIELSAEKLKPQPLLFNGMFHKKRDDIPFEKYFPVKELDMDEKEFNQAVRNILESPQKNEFIEAINEELAKKEKSADAASYINERNKDEAYKIPITVGYAKDKLDTGSIIGGSIIALKTALATWDINLDEVSPSAVAEEYLTKISAAKTLEEIPTYTEDSATGAELTYKKGDVILGVEGADAVTGSVDDLKDTLVANIRASYEKEVDDSKVISSPCLIYIPEP